MVKFQQIDEKEWNIINAYTPKQTKIPDIEKIAQPDVTGKVISPYGGGDVFSFVHVFPNADEYIIIDSASFATKDSKKPKFFDSEVIGEIQDKISTNNEFPFSGFAGTAIGVDFADVYGSMTNYAGARFKYTDPQEIGLSNIILARLRLNLNANIINIAQDETNQIYQVTFEINGISKNLIYIQHRFGEGRSIDASLLDNSKGILIKSPSLSSDKQKVIAITNEINNLFKDNFDGVMVTCEKSTPKEYITTSKVIENVYNNHEIKFYVHKINNGQSIVTEEIFRSPVPEGFIMIKIPGIGSMLVPKPENKIPSLTDDEKPAISESLSESNKESDFTIGFKQSMETKASDEKAIEAGESSGEKIKTEFDHTSYAKGSYLGISISMICEITNDYAFEKPKSNYQYIVDFIDRASSHTVNNIAVYASYLLFNKPHDNNFAASQAAINIVYLMGRSLINEAEGIADASRMFVNSIFALYPDIVTGNPGMAGFATTVFEKNSCIKLAYNSGEHLHSHWDNIAGYSNEFICTYLNIC